MLLEVRGGATHCFWFLVKKAKAFAPISCAFRGAFSTPPDALMCAPTYFMGSDICLPFSQRLFIDKDISESQSCKFRIEWICLFPGKETGNDHPVAVPLLKYLNRKLQALFYALFSP